MAEQRYRAFLSYAHADAAWAVWVHRSLERYQLPRLLSEAAPHRTLKPIFRDQDELGASASLTDVLIDALARSDSLIVICSPAAAASTWVNQEVETFRRQQPEAPVICVLVDGSVDGPEPVFPDALLTDPGAEPLAIDPRPTADGRRLALIKLVASLIDLPVDQVRRRDVEWRRRRLGVGAATSLGLASLLVAVTWFVIREPDCLPHETLEAELYSDGHRQQIAAAFTATGLPFAERSFEAVDGALSRFSRAWAGSHLAACEATRVRREQSDRMLDRRMACLADRRQAFIALRETLGTTSKTSLEFSVPAALQLKGVARCNDLIALEAAYPPPEDQETLAAVTELSQAIATASARLHAVRTGEFIEQAENYAARATEIGYPPLEARALLLLGEAEELSARPEDARDTYYSAAARSVAARDAELAATAWLRIPDILTQTEKNLADIENALNLAGSYVDQLPEDVTLHGRYLQTRGASLIRDGQAEEGLELLREAVSFARQHHTEELASYLESLAWALTGEYDLDGAEAASQEALAITLSIYGDQHPRYAASLREAARVAARRGEYERAVEMMDEVLAITRASYPPTHIKLAHALNASAWNLKNLGRWDDARAVLEEALALHQSLPEPYWLAYGSSHNIYADYYLSRGEYAMARSHMQDAIAAWSSSSESHPNLSVALNNLGNLENREGRHEDARIRCQEALEIDLATHGADFIGAAFPLTCLGEAYIGLGGYGQAVEVLERAHALRDYEGTNPGQLAWSRWLLGRALFEQGADLPRAKEYVLFAYKVFESSGEGAASELSDVVTWLAERQLDWRP